ncbi:stress-activated map kinase interacting protein 1-domain-containing protein [Mortierella sp. GBAus27b]|nr:stress-activated map kinase interacting protein 1-domain-containing protein [Mortierella sp. GBAus27b]
MSLLTDPAYIVHNLRLSNLRLKDRSSSKIITFPPQLLANEYIKAAGPVSPEATACYSPHVSHEYLMLGNSNLLLSPNDATLENTTNPVGTTKPAYGGRVKGDRRRMAAAAAAAAAVAAANGRGGNDASTTTVVPMQPVAAPATRSAVPMGAGSMETDDEIDLDDEEPLKSPPGMFPKMAIPAHVGGDFAPGIFITTPSRPGSATIPDDAHSQQTTVKDSETASNSELQTEQDTEIGDMTLDSIGSPIDLSPTESAVSRHLDTTMSSLSPFPTPSPLALLSTKGGMPSMDGLLLKPTIVRPPPVSLLTSQLNQLKTQDENPFAEEFLKIAGTGEPNPVQLKIYLPTSDKPKDPMLVVVKREATVEDVIGYILYQYCKEGRTPLLGDEQSTVVVWNLRIVEDDGEIDDDLPAVERTLKIGRFATSQRFAMNQFALCEATPAQVQINENLWAKSGRPPMRPKKQKSVSSPTSPGPPDGGLPGEKKPPMSDRVMIETGVVNDIALSAAITAAAAAAASPGIGASTAQPRSDLLGAGMQHYVRVRLHTNHEVKHWTTVEILPKMLVSGVIEYICHKRKMDPSEWMLVIDETQTVLPLDEAAEDIPGTKELSLIHKSSEMFTSSRRGRGMREIPGSSVSYITSSEVFREYTLNRKRRGGYVGHHEQVLAIDGDFIRIMPSKSLLFDSGKTASYFKNAIYDCRQNKKAPSYFKLMVTRERERKVYEFEAKTSQIAQEICQRIMQLKDS